MNRYISALLVLVLLNSLAIITMGVATLNRPTSAVWSLSSAGETGAVQGMVFAESRFDLQKLAWKLNLTFMGATEANVDHLEININGVKLVCPNPQPIPIDALILCTGSKEQPFWQMP